MRVYGVSFLGDETRAALGIFIDGARPLESVIEGCVFNGLHTGMEIVQEIPAVRRCVFENLDRAGVVIRDPGGKALEPGDLFLNGLALAALLFLARRRTYV